MKYILLTLFTALLILTVLYVLLRSIRLLTLVIEDVQTLVSYCRSNVEDGGVEYTEESNIVGRYDVEAFKRRIDSMKKDEDGLYEVSSTPPRTDFTGVEVITENYELEVDKHIGV